MEHLILAALLMDERQGGSGESLNAAVDATRQVLVDADLGSQFDALVVRAGYFGHQRELYDEPRYTVRSEHLWRISDNFPRITENDLRAGVGDCQYRITTSGLEQYALSPEQLTAVLRRSHD